MTEPLDIDAIRARHIWMEIGLLGQTCAHCGNAWPCDAVERLRGPKLTPDEEWEIARAKWQQDLYKRAGQMMARAASSRGLLDAIDNESGQSEAPTVSEGGKG